MSFEGISFSGKNIKVEDIYSISFNYKGAKLMGFSLPITKTTISITFRSSKNKRSSFVDSLVQSTEVYGRLHNRQKNDIKQPLYMTTLQTWTNDDPFHWLVNIHQQVLSKKNSYQIFQEEDGEVTRFGYIYD